MPHGRHSPPSSSSPTGCHTGWLRGKTCVPSLRLSAISRCSMFVKSCVLSFACPLLGVLAVWRQRV
eukprot:1655063-Rhodomonas_salina.1